MMSQSSVDSPSCGDGITMTTEDSGNESLPFAEVALPLSGQDNLTSTPVSSARSPHAAQTDGEHSQYPLLHFRQLLDADDSAIGVDPQESKVTAESAMITGHHSVDSVVVCNTPKSSQDSAVICEISMVTGAKGEVIPSDATKGRSDQEAPGVGFTTGIDLDKNSGVITTTDMSNNNFYDVLMQATVDMDEEEFEEDDDDDNRSSSETSTAYSSEDEESNMNLPAPSPAGYVSSVMNGSLTESTACLSLAEHQSPMAVAVTTGDDLHMTDNPMTQESSMAFGSACITQAEPIPKPAKSQSLVWQKQGCFLSPPKMDIVALATSCTLSGALYDQEASNEYTDQPSDKNANDQKVLTSSSYSVFFNEDQYSDGPAYVTESYDRDRYNTVDDQSEATDGQQRDSKLMELAAACSSYSNSSSTEAKDTAEVWPDAVTDNQTEVIPQPDGVNQSESVITTPTEIIASTPNHQIIDTTDHGSPMAANTAPRTLEESSVYPYEEPKVTYVISNGLDSTGKIQNVAPINITPAKGYEEAQDSEVFAPAPQSTSMSRIQLLSKVNKLEMKLAKMHCYPMLATPVQQLWDIYKQRLYDLEAQQHRWSSHKAHSQSAQNMLQGFFDSELEVLLNFIDMELDNVISRRSFGPLPGVPQPMPGPQAIYPPHPPPPPPPLAKREDVWGMKPSHDMPGVMGQPMPPCNCSHCPPKPSYETHAILPAPCHVRPPNVDPAHGRAYGAYGPQRMVPVNAYPAGMIPVVSNTPMETDNSMAAGGGYHIVPGPTSAVPSTFFTPPASPLTSPQDISAQRATFQGNCHLPQPVPQQNKKEDVKTIKRDKLDKPSVTMNPIQPKTESSSQSQIKATPVPAPAPAPAPGVPWYPRVHFAPSNKPENGAPVPVFAVPNAPLHPPVPLAAPPFRMPTVGKSPSGSKPRGPRPGSVRGPRQKKNQQGVSAVTAKSKPQPSPPPKNIQLNRQLHPLAIGIMDKWYKANIHHPYPSAEVVEFFVQAGSVSVDQVKKWFANKRMRSGNTKTLHELAVLRRQFNKDCTGTSGSGNGQDNLHEVVTLR